MAVFQLDDRLCFPDPRLGEEDGLVAVGGDLSVERLLLAYSNGFFPWFSFRYQKEPCWYCPLDRFVIIPQGDTYQPFHETADAPEQVYGDCQSGF